MTLRRSISVLVLASVHSVLMAQEPAMTPQAYDALFTAVSNAGRWGKDDALGKVVLANRRVVLAGERHPDPRLLVPSPRGLRESLLFVSPHPPPYGAGVGLPL